MIFILFCIIFILRPFNAFESISTFVKNEYLCQPTCVIVVQRFALETRVMFARGGELLTVLGHFCCVLLTSPDCRVEVSC